MNAPDAVAGRIAGLLKLDDVSRSESAGEVMPAEITERKLRGCLDLFNELLQVDKVLGESTTFKYFGNKI